MKIMRMGLMPALAVVLAGCGLELLGTTAIRSGLEAEQAKTLKRTLDYAQETTSRMSAEQGIAAYRAEKGVNPPSLEAAVREGYLTEIPRQADGTSYGYDPVTGMLIEGAAPVPYAQVPPAASSALAPSHDGGQGSFAEDLKTIQQVRGAIGRFKKDTGRFPPSLHALTPKYLAEIPKTSGGQDFLYDPATGIVHHPSQAPQQPAAAYGMLAPAPQAGAYQTPPQRPGRAVGGGGPMGEVMTGIAIQQELNSMSSGGANVAASRVRTDARGIGEQQTQRHERAMDNLGL